MDNFISTIVFVLPGLLCYYWLQWLGFVPSQKHNVFEMAGISALLWIPVSALSLVTYNLLVFFINDDIKNNHISPVFEIYYISNLIELKASLGSLWFILFFAIASIIYSYVFARLWTVYLFHWFLKHVNHIRKNKLYIGELSKKTTVWEEIFMEAGPKVIKVIKLDKPEEYIIGSIRKTSRPLEPERHIALDEIDYFTKLIKKYSPLIKNVFIDTKAGIAVYIYHPESIIEIQKRDQESKEPIISPWVSD